MKIRLVRNIIISVFAFVIFVILLFNSFVIVNAGNVKVLTQLGRTTGVIFYPGFHIKAPFFQNTVNYSTRQVTYETSDASEVSTANYPDYVIDTTSSDGQQVKLKYTIRFSIDSKQTVWILNNIGTMDDLVEKVVKAESRSISRNIPKKYTAAQLYSRGVFDVQEEIHSTLREKFSKNGVIMDDFLLRKIDFTDQYFNVLEEKQIAEERIVVEKNILEQEKIKKEQAIVKAQAEAEQIKIKGEALKSYPQIIQLEFIQKMSPNINWGILPEGVLPFLDLAKISGGLGGITQNTQDMGQESTNTSTDATDIYEETTTTIE
ncbi:MAG: prohibitin family protein [Actinomycetota bacterium]|nr:prohibitin family protein [Actinomycetota bacterium]